MALSPTASRLTQSEVPAGRPIPTLVEDVEAGLLTPPRWLPPKYFYDDHGSRLFEAICDTPEYYPTRTEAALLAACSKDVIDQVRPGHLLELGSGSSRKTRYLLDACSQLGVQPVYWPFDVSAQMMLDAGAALVEQHDWLNVHALIGDYSGGLAQLPLPDDGRRRLIVFLGGTLGNFEPPDAVAMLREIAALMKPGDGLLLGLDRVKDKARLEAAYDDAAGHTAAFNLNVLSVLNRELDADFPVEAYRHRAVFDEPRARIEMRLLADRAHTVCIGALDTRISIAAGEQILTEISRKFTRPAIDELLTAAGLSMRSHFEADGGDYSLVLAGADPRA
ncbi:MAG: L-histidine N(alpha)-methyltransferase [Salinisphaera sp.]|jgi:L-histidine N-alpha-methyltransferase|nr:L-histidine N(alpha)-methyltransferase [Salinisphaera sp.]